MGVRKMKKDNNDLLITIIGIAMSVVLFVILVMFYSFINMYVWNNVLLHFFELPTITLVGGFGISILKDTFIKQVPTRDRDVSAYEHLFGVIAFRVTILLFAWIFTLLV